MRNQANESRSLLDANRTCSTYDNGVNFFDAVDTEEVSLCGSGSLGFGFLRRMLYLVYHQERNKSVTTE